jgi:hypothetical protein
MLIIILFLFSIVTCRMLVSLSKYIIFGIYIFVWLKNGIQNICMVGGEDR